MSSKTEQERWTPQKLHIRIFVLEIVTFLSLVLNLALWYFTGSLNSKVEDRTTPSTLTDKHS